MVKRARKTDALALPAGKANTSLSHVRLKPVRQFGFNQVEDLCHCASFAQPRRIDLIVRHPKRDVARDSIVDQENILRHITDGGLPRRHQRRRKRSAVDQHLACRWMVKAKQQVNQS